MQSSSPPSSSELDSENHPLVPRSSILKVIGVIFSLPSELPKSYGSSVGFSS